MPPPSLAAQVAGIVFVMLFVIVVLLLMMPPPLLPVVLPLTIDNPFSPTPQRDPTSKTRNLFSPLTVMRNRYSLRYLLVQPSIVVDGNLR
jgi:DNA-binding helix-hairpin-helix protein with protein kinase domain